MALSLRGARVLLTGASAGIGAATAPVLARRGAVLAVTGRRVDRLHDLVASLPGDGHVALPADLADGDAPERVVADAAEALGAIDVVIHNAAMPKRRHLAQLTLAEVDEVMALNFRVPVRMTMATLPGMLERGRGAQVYVSSLGGRLGIADEAAYCASKFALAGWAEAAAIDLWDEPVGVHLVLPGAIDTEIWDRPGATPPTTTAPRAAGNRRRSPSPMPSSREGSRCTAPISGAWSSSRPPTSKRSWPASPTWLGRAATDEGARGLDFR